MENSDKDEKLFFILHCFFCKRNVLAYRRIDNLSKWYCPRCNSPLEEVMDYAR